MSKFKVFSGLYFPTFRLNTDITEQISVFSPNVGKYGTNKKKLISDPFVAVKDIDMMSVDVVILLSLFSIVIVSYTHFSIIIGKSN